MVFGVVCVHTTSFLILEFSRISEEYKISTKKWYIPSKTILTAPLGPPPHFFQNKRENFGLGAR
jgi:hypothetical protein